MRHPVQALLWQCWRQSQRWYLLVLAIAIAVHLAIMNIARPDSVPAQIPYHEVLAFRSIMANFMLAMFSTLFAITIAGRTGFPQRFEFRLPISTSLLVAVPMLYLAAACASLYVIPVLMSRLYYGIPIPLVPAAALLSTMVVALAASSWSTTGTSTRTMAVIFVVLSLLRLLDWMSPMNFTILAKKRGDAIFRTDIIALTSLEYVLLALLSLSLFALTVYSVGLQRRSETWSLPKSGLNKPVAASNPQASYSSSPPSPGFIDRIDKLFNVKCPVSSPWRAELWLEVRRYGMPALALALVLALVLPPLLLVAKWLEWKSMKDLVWMPALAVFFVGIGVAFFNRRQHSGGYMNSFEGTRGMSTLQLAAIQFAVSATTTMIGIVICSVSLWLCLPLLDKPGSVIARVQAALATAGEMSLLAQVSVGLVSGALYLATIALLAFMHACSVFWGRKAVYAMLGLVLYSIYFTSNAGARKVELLYLQRHMWGFAAGILLLTLFALGRVLYLKLLSRRAGITSVAGWLGFLLCAWYFLRSVDVNLATQAAELQAFNAALLTLPFTLLLLTVWSYDKLRHR